MNASNRGKRGSDDELISAVRKIIEDVRLNGWNAAFKYTRKFDCPSLEPQEFAVLNSEIESAKVEPSHHTAILQSIDRVRSFHDSQLRIMTSGLDSVLLGNGPEKKLAWEWRSPASNLANAGFEGQRLIPIRSVGVYVPGGMASYPSSVIMNAVPAIVAGAEVRVLCTPPSKDGRVSAAVLVAARELGIKTIIKCGGAQAVALMAYGSKGERNKKIDWFDWGEVDKIVGPGNRWVNEAKRQLWGRVGLDTFAGPSEVCVVADESADPAFAAADWLTQVEHAEDNVGYLVVRTREVAESILREAEDQLRGSPREGTMRLALKTNGLIIIANPWPALGLGAAHALAAEHTTLFVTEQERSLDTVQRSSCIALGHYTPQSAGDFCAGPSHTLPTGGAARFSSPLNVMDFLKFQSISQFTKEDLQELLPTIEAFGEMEGFPQHARAARMRFEG